MPPIDEELLENQQKQYTPKDAYEIQIQVVEKEGKLSELFRQVARLKPFWEDAKTILSMIKDWLCGNYRDIPFATIASLAGALIYVLCPTDLIADILPVIGYLDDVALLLYVIKKARGAIARYRKWQQQQSK